MKKIIRFLEVFQNIEVVFALIIIVLLLLPYVFGFTPYVVKSGSMEPAIKTGSVVYVKKNVDYKKINVHDIIAYKLDDKTLVTHRVAEVHDEYFITKGDANQNNDTKFIYFSDVIGITKFSISYIGLITSAINGTTAKVLISAIIILNAGICIFINKTKLSKKESDGKKHEKFN